MAQVPTGTTVAVAAVFASSLPFTTASNATEAVLGMASTTGLSAGDIVEVTSGWGRLNLRSARIKAVTANVSITLEGMDTTNTTFYPVGVGAGSVRKVTTWQTIDKITGISSSGGDPVSVDYKYMDSDVRYSINDGFNASSYQLTIDADAIGGAGYTTLKSLTDVQTNTILRITTRSGQVNLVPGTVALNEAVQLNDGQINTVTCAVNGNNRLTRYAS
ncbi:phage tail tube protein [Roseateles sp. BYS96W]|uniref:Phage tail tube protein n=1 Tax=Pelomonas nitida TaxID=3299027 RepID=A0ABW7G7D1_9BURK